MKIVHIAPNSPYNDDWGYQENLLPRYQKKLGHDVTLITTNTMYADGAIVQTPCTDDVLSDGVRVIRRARRRCGGRILTNLYAKMDVYALLCELQPDVIFFHGLVSAAIYDVVRYRKKHPSCVVLQDNHMDYNNGYRVQSLRKKLVRAFYRHMNRRSIPYVARVYGVTPQRKRYAEDYFAIPAAKTDVLMMGADDESIDFANRDKIRADIRKANRIADDDFLVVTGGKFDEKKKVDALMEACAGLQGVKLLIFGKILDDVKEKFHRLIRENENICYVGWLDAGKVYDYFFAADLVFFSGQHSVLWEQACAAKVPCVFRKIDGMEHVNNGGNAAFVSEASPEAMRRCLLALRFTPAYEAMRKIAASAATDVFLYSRIAQKSLECAVRNEGKKDSEK